MSTHFCLNSKCSFPLHTQESKLEWRWDKSFSLHKLYFHSRNERSTLPKIQEQVVISIVRFDQYLTSGRVRVQRLPSPALWETRLQSNFILRLMDCPLRQYSHVSPDTCDWFFAKHHSLVHCNNVLDSIQSPNHDNIHIHHTVLHDIENQSNCKSNIGSPCDSLLVLWDRERVRFILPLRYRYWIRSCKSLHLYNS